ncbi:MAG: hypothetical protein ABI351_05320 [Herbaspirillum sp.]
MTPEEIVSQITRMNRAVLTLENHDQTFTNEQLLAMMDAAAMRGFRFGSNVALSMVEGELVVRLLRVSTKNPVLLDNVAAVRRN